MSDRLGDIKGLPIVGSYDLGIGETVDGEPGVVLWLHTTEGPYRFHLEDPISLGCDILAAGLEALNDPETEALYMGTASAYLGARYVERHGWPKIDSDEVD